MKFGFGRAFLRKGEWDKSEQYFTKAMEQSQKMNEFQQIAGSHYNFGLLYLDKGEYALAKESFEEAVKACKKAGDKADAILTSIDLVPTLVELSEFEEAQNLIGSLQKLAQETEEKALIGLEKALRAMLLRGQKKWEESIELFENAVNELEAINLRMWEAYYFAKWVLCEYARVYLERNQEGDREKADKLLNQALEMFQKMGAKKDIEKILAKKKLLTS